MSFKPEDHFMQLKGRNYLPVQWRLVWLREEHPDAQIDTEVVWWDHDKQEIMVRASVVLPQNGARATAHCVCSEREFKFGYCEKAESQAVGRALALLGYGTQFAGVDLDEGGSVADSPVPERAVPAVHVQKTGGSTQQRSAASARVAVAESRPAQPLALPANTADWTQQQLGAGIRTLAGIDPAHTLKLSDWQQLARTHEGVLVPQNAGQMSQAWLLSLYQAMRARGYEERLRGAQEQDAIPPIWDEVLDSTERREVTAAQCAALDAVASERYRALAPAEPAEQPS